MRKKLLSKITGVVAIFLLSLAVVPHGMAQDLKIGYVDPRMILQRMPEAKAVQQRIQNLSDRKQIELTEKQRELQSEREAYQQKVDVLSEEALRTEETRLTRMDLEFRQLQSNAQAEIQQESAELMEPLFNQIQSSVDQVSEELGFDLILNVTMSGYNILDRNIIYTSSGNQPSLNITSAVMQNLGI